MPKEKHILTDLTVNEVSLVTKGANGKVFSVIKSAEPDLTIADKVKSMDDSQFKETADLMKQAFIQINKGGQLEMEKETEMSVVEKVMQNYEATMTTMNQNFSSVAKSLESLTTKMDDVLKACTSAKEDAEAKKVKEQEEEVKKAEKEKADAEEKEKAEQKAKEKEQEVAKSMSDIVKAVADLASVVTKTAESVNTMTSSVSDVTKSVEQLASVPVGSNALDHEDVSKSAGDGCKWPSFFSAQE